MFQSQQADNRYKVDPLPDSLPQEDPTFVLGKWSNQKILVERSRSLSINIVTG